MQVGTPIELHAAVVLIYRESGMTTLLPLGLPLAFDGMTVALAQGNRCRVERRSCFRSRNDGGPFYDLVVAKPEESFVADANTRFERRLTLGV